MIIPNFALFIFYSNQRSYKNLGISILTFIVFYIGLELVGMKILGEGAWMISISLAAFIEIIINNLSKFEKV